MASLLCQKVIEVAKSRDHGWVDYLCSRPGGVEKYHKSAYVKEAMIKGKMVVVARECILIEQ